MSYLPFLFVFLLFPNMYSYLYNKRSSSISKSFDNSTFNAMHNIYEFKGAEIFQSYLSSTFYNKLYHTSDSSSLKNEKKKSLKE